MIVAPHPNQVDLRRIERTLRARKRYKYVHPSVHPVDAGYEITSPNCSRNIAADGGEILIARLRYDIETQCWSVLVRDHAHGLWVEHTRHAKLHEALAVINDDPQRRFWP